MGNHAQVTVTLPPDFQKLESGVFLARGGGSLTARYTMHFAI
jgi:hypothetical protein